MSGGKDRLFIRQSFFSPFEEIGSEEIVVDNDLRCPVYRQAGMSQITLLRCRFPLLLILLFPSYLPDW